MSQYNNIKITPNIGVSSDPKIEFIGAGNSTVTLKVLDTVDGGITFEGQKGELLSLIDADVSFGSSIPSFSINDYYGVPQIQAYNDGRVIIAPYGSQFIGIGTLNPETNLDVVGDIRVTGVSSFFDGPVLVGSGTSTGTESQKLQVTGNAYVSGNLGIGTTNPTSKLDVRGDISLVGIETYITTIQAITATADRFISFPDRTGVVALVQGINGSVLYNNAGYSAGGNLGYGITTGTFGYIANGGSVTQATNKSTGIALTASCGRITMNNENLSPGIAVTFTMTNGSISANDLLILNHVSGGTAGSYALNAQCSAGSANINVTNIGLTTLGEAIVVGFAVIKTTV